MNVLLILADQFRSDCLRHLGNEVIQTPNLDRLASEGVSFPLFQPDSPVRPQPHVHLYQPLPVFDAGRPQRDPADGRRGQPRLLP